jgi:septal ring-binding cell division protein DamX
VKSDGSVPTLEPEVPAVAPLQQNALATSATTETAGIAVTGESIGAPPAGVSSEEETTAATIASPAGMTGQDDATGTVDSQDVQKHGPWVINLLSSPSKSDADRFADKARKLGIPVEQSRIRLKGREYFRVQLTGFPTEKQAGESAGPVKERLRLKDVWIFKL